MNPQERQELVEYRIHKARETFNEVSLHVENKLWNTSVNRLYYACYYAVIALLVDKDIHAQTHSGVRQMFGLHYVKTGLISKDLAKYYTDLFDRRQTGDYDDFVLYNEETVLSLYKQAKGFIDRMIKLK